MKKIIIPLIVVLFLLPVVLLADTVNFRTTVAKNDQTVGGDFWLDLEMAVTDGSDNTLYGLTVKIDYTNQISYQSASDWGPSGYFYQEVIDQGTNIQVGIFNFGDPSNPWTVTSTYQRVVRMKFTITTATSVTIGIQDFPATTASYWNNGNFVWTVTNDDLGDVTLPVELSTFTAQYLNSVPTLYWVTQSETENIGWYVYRGTEDNFTTTERVTDLLEGHGTTSEPHSYFYYDEELEAISGEMYWYWIENVDLGGAFHRYGPQVLTIPEIPESPPANEKPIQYGLHQNIPNPLVGDGSTRISFVLPKTAKAELKIYNIRGELVKDLFNGTADCDDEVERIWDGKDETGVVQAPGIYLYQLKLDGKVYQIKRLILMK